MNRIMKLNEVFNKTKETKITPEAIHSALILSWMNTYGKFIENESSLNKLNTLKEEISAKMRDLACLGLEKSQNYQNLLSLLNSEKFKTVDKDAYEFIKNVRYHYPEAIIVPYSDYIGLLKKYNLITNDIREFTGIIPSDQLGSLTKFDYLRYANSIEYDLDSFYRISEITIYNNKILLRRLIKTLVNNIRRFPYSHSVIDINNRYGLGDSISDKTQNALINDLNVKLDMIDNRRKLIISCDPNQINPIPVTIKSKPIPEPTPVSVPDPIIGILSRYGVVVGPKWGDEAKDELFDRLSNLISDKNDF